MASIGKVSVRSNGAATKTAQKQTFRVSVQVAVKGSKIRS